MEKTYDQRDFVDYNQMDGLWALWSSGCRSVFRCYPFQFSVLVNGAPMEVFCTIGNV